MEVSNHGANQPSESQISCNAINAEMTAEQRYYEAIVSSLSEERSAKASHFTPSLTVSGATKTLLPNGKPEYDDLAPSFCIAGPKAWTWLLR